MSVTWEYWGNFSSQKELKEFYGGAGGNYVNWTILDGQKPKKSVSLSATGVSVGDMLAEQAKLDAPGTASYTLATGQSVTGIPTSFSATPIEHTPFYNLKVTVRVDVTTTPIWHAYGTESRDKQLTEFRAAPTGGGYGEVTLYDISKPKRTISISAEAVSESYSAAVLAMMDTPGEKTLDGFTGTPTSVSRSPIKGTGLYNVSVTMRVE